MKKKMLVVVALVVLILILVGSAFAAGKTERKSKYLSPFNGNWFSVAEDGDRLIKARNTHYCDGIYGVSINGYMPGVIELKSVMKKGADFKVVNPVTGKETPSDTFVHRYLVAKRDGNYVYTLASISYYNKGKFLADDDYPENYKDLSKYERNENFDPLAEKLYGKARLPIIR